LRVLVPRRGVLRIRLPQISVSRSGFFAVAAEIRAGAGPSGQHLFRLGRHDWAFVAAVAKAEEVGAQPRPDQIMATGFASSDRRRFRRAPSRANRLEQDGEGCARG